MEIILRKEQKEIIKYKSGKLGIPAVPGAGKTFILSHLVSKLAKEQLEDGEEILILTYMNSSVINFKEKIRELLGNEDKKILRRIKVMTIHSLASDILKDHNDKVSLEGNYQNLTKANIFYLMSLAISEYRQENPNEFKYFIKQEDRTERSFKRWNDELINITLKMISKCKNEDISLSLLLSKTKNYKRESLLKVSSEIYEKYEKLCRKGAYLDYDDLLYLAYNVLKKSSKVREKYLSQYKYILEDEAQDSNKIQNKMLKLISNGNLVKVGDLNQSILATFTNSTPMLFKEFLKANPKIEMFTAGRSSCDVIALANYFVEENGKSHPLKEGKQALAKQLIKPVEAGEYPRNPEVSVYGLKTVLEENEYKEMYKMIAFVEKFNKKYPEKKIAILFPKNAQIEKTARIFKKKKIDFQILADVSEKLIDTLEFLGDLLLYLSRPHNNKFLTEFLVNRLELDIEKDKRLIAFVNGVSLERLFFDIENLIIPVEITEGKAWKKVIEELKKVKYVLEFPQNSLEKLLLFIGDIFQFSNDQQLLIEKMSMDLKRIFKLNPKWSLYDLAKEIKKTRASEFTFLAKSVEQELEEKPEEKHNITLTTYHRSKGMEWDMVWLFNLNSKSFPAYLSDNNYGRQGYLKNGYEFPIDYLETEFRKEFISKEYEDVHLKKKAERVAECVRLIYVGITRAKQYLIVSSNKEDDNYYFRKIKSFIEEEKVRYERRKKE